MPFTPFHMGPGILIKSLLQGGFSLMVFGWSQIIMDLQPLWVMIVGHGHLHGFSHTFIGALLLAMLAALTGKYLATLGLALLNIRAGSQPVGVTWPVAFMSAVIGTFSHVLLDAIMHADVQPLFPFTLDNQFLYALSFSAIHQLCVYSGLIGAVIFYVVQWYNRGKTGK